MRTEEGFVYLTAQEMAEFDRIAIEDFGIEELVLMENAGVAIARVAKMMLGGKVAGRSISCLVGKGNNGGDGVVAARHLHNWGADVRIALGGERTELREIPAKQVMIAEKMGIRSSGPQTSFLESDLLVDALFGYSLRGDPREPAASMISQANASRVRILAADIPSGLDATTGEAGEPCIAADTTVTLGLPKVGFLNPEARKRVGALYLADISFPAALYQRYSQSRTVFEKEPLVRVW